ncbi:hypothetical protein MG293_010302 [Ovis ammon polii]|uniref:Uncharacterized protein n=1 Tax=Ovis ammon polii TaxID=230172 RepID=A0AAD4YAA6_OVIAM|nr:hypothetical protein MG293_010302 [Ovis ammon polii]
MVPSTRVGNNTSQTKANTPQTVPEFMQQEPRSTWKCRQGPSGKALSRAAHSATRLSHTPHIRKPTNHLKLKLRMTRFYMECSVWQHSRTKGELDEAEQTTLCYPNVDTPNDRKRRPLLDLLVFSGKSGETDGSDRFCSPLEMGPACKRGSEVHI